MKRRLKLRIIYCPDESSLYYLQRKNWLGLWRTLSGYHQGNKGEYSYQFIGAMNPHYLINYAIPNVLKEHKRRTVPKDTRAMLKSGREADFKKIEIAGVIDIEATRKAIQKDKARLGRKSSDPKPDAVWKWKKGIKT